MNKYPEILGQTPEIQGLLRSAEIIAATDVTLLIEGETGTGKELLARRVHQQSRRAQQPFITLNCAALSDELAESALFGHKKGSFTSAIEHHEGYIKQAEGGTLFLDEIGELSLSIQAKILRFIEYGECQRIGDTQIQQYDVRIIAATNRQLEKEVERGAFREDLFYRLQIVPLKMPALQQRRDDIIFLAEHFIQQAAQQHNLQAPVLTASAQNKLKHYHWPGNVRELRNCCERLVILLSGQQITEHNLPLNIQQQENCGFQLPDMGIKLDQLEVDLMQQALSRTSGNKSRAARLLGLSRDAFLYRLKKYSL